jgi:hypothetical protein
MCKIELSIALFLTILLNSCQFTSETSESSSNILFKESIEYFPVKVGYSTQVFKGSIYFISDYKSLYKIEGTDLKLVYSLKDKKVIELMVEKFFQNEHTYPFMTDRNEPYDHIVVDQFYITDEFIYLSVGLLMPYIGEYEGKEAQYNLFQRAILKIDASSLKVADVHSIMASKNDFHNRQTNLADMNRGFAIFDDKSGVVCNLTFTEGKQEIPELLRIHDLDSFKWNMKPLVYYDEIPKRQLTNTRGYFHGENRKRYCGTFGCLEFKNDTFEFLFKNPISTKSSQSIVFGLSDVWVENQDNYVMRSVLDEDKKMISLELVQNKDSVIYAQEIRDIANFRSLDFIDKSAWYIWNDTLSDGFYLYRYSLDQ